MNLEPLRDALATQEAWQAAVAEMNRLQRELDITNADHIALWFEANTIQDEMMSQCVSWLACRIVEAHEAAVAEKDAEITRQREVIEAWHDIDRKRDAEIERLKQLLGEIGQACALADKKYDLPDEISGHLYSRCIRASLGVEEPSHDEG